MTQPEPTAGDAPWLVVIDMQEIFARPDSPWGAPGFAAIVPTVQQLVTRHAPRVVFTRFVAPEHPAGAWVDYYRQWPFALVPADDPLYELVPEVRREGSPVISCTTFGKWGEELARLTAGADLLLTGVSTDCCVLSTALGAADAGVRVRVVADACAGASPEDHARALEAMALYAPLIELTTSAALA